MGTDFIDATVQLYSFTDFIAEFPVYLLGKWITTWEQSFIQKQHLQNKALFHMANADTDGLLSFLCHALKCNGQISQVNLY